MHRRGFFMIAALLVSVGMPIETTTLGTLDFVVTASNAAANATYLTASDIVEPDPETWVLAGGLVPERNSLAAVLFTWGPLAGKVLVAGGHTTDNPSSVSNIYDPGTGTWRATGSLQLARYWPTATLLPSGKVLVAGGKNDHTAFSVTSAELYDPVTETWTPTGSMNVRHAGHTATLLADGKVLVAGGYESSGFSINVAELYDPSTGTWALARPMPVQTSGHTATLLENGKVLVAAGYGGWNQAQLYDPASDTWTPTGRLISLRAYPVAELLADGRVLIAGGHGPYANGPALRTAEVYDPATGLWTATGSMSEPRYWFSATRLRSNLVLVAGGGGSFSAPWVYHNSAELYDPSTGTWSTAAAMSNRRYMHAAVRLPSGYVLAVGGLLPASGNQTELYMPPGPANTMPTADAGPDQAIDATAATTSVTLHGSGSDAESLALGFTWRDGAGTVVATGAVATLDLAIGMHVFTLTVDDGESGTASDTVSIEVRDTVAPVVSIDAPTASNYGLGEIVLASFACSDIGSGVVSCLGTVDDGAAVDTSSGGAHVFAVTATDAAGNVTTASVTYIVRGVATIHVVPYSVTYDGHPHMATGTAIGVSGEDLSALLDLSGTTHTAAGTYTDTWTFAGNDNYEAVSGTVTDVVRQATPILTWAAPAAIVYGTALGPAQLNATASGVEGSFSYLPAGGTMLPAGTHTLRVSFTPVDAVNYTGATSEVSLVVERAPLAIRANDQAMVLNGPLPALTATYTGFVNGESEAVLDSPVVLATSATGGLVGSFVILASGAADSNYAITFTAGTLWVRYAAGGWCLGEPAHVVLQPINPDGSSVFKRNSTVTIKFRVADANGQSIGTAGLVTEFRLYQIVAGTVTTAVNEPVDSTTPFTEFRWDPTAQQWIFHLSTHGLSASRTYYYRIVLNDGSTIEFRFGLR